MPKSHERCDGDRQREHRNVLTNAARLSSAAPAREKPGAVTLLCISVAPKIEATQALADARRRLALVGYGQGHGSLPGVKRTVASVAGEDRHFLFHGLPISPPLKRLCL